MDLNRCSTAAERMAQRASSADTIDIDGQTYTLTFKPSEWVYTVHDSEGNFVVNFNTKKITQAKKWLREHLIC